eukprot:7641309-Alexandrium_andersonii.AAC.1
MVGSPRGGLRPGQPLHCAVGSCLCGVAGGLRDVARRFLSSRSGCEGWRARDLWSAGPDCGLRFADCGQLQTVCGCRIVGLQERGLRIADCKIAGLQGCKIVKSAECCRWGMLEPMRNPRLGTPVARWRAASPRSHRLAPAEARLLPPRHPHGLHSPQYGPRARAGVRVPRGGEHGDRGGGARGEGDPPDGPRVRHGAAGVGGAPRRPAAAAGGDPRRGMVRPAAAAGGDPLRGMVRNATDGGLWMADGGLPRIEGCRMQLAAFCGLRVAGCELQICSSGAGRIADCRLRIAGAADRIEDCRLRVADRRLQTADCRLQLAGESDRIEECALRIADRRMQTAECGLRNVGRGLQIADCGLRVFRGRWDPSAICRGARSRARCDARVLRRGRRGGRQHARLG